MAIDRHQAEFGGPALIHRHHRKGDVGLGLTVPLDEVGIIHPVQVIAGQNQILIDIPLREEPNILAHGVGRSFEPTRAFGSLLSREYFDKSLGETSSQSGIGAGNMPVERGGIKLCQNVNSLDIGVDTITDRNIDQAILGAQRHRRLGAQLGQGIEPGADPTA